MVDPLFQEPGFGWRLERQGTIWWTQCLRSKCVAGGRKDRGLYDGRNV